MGGFWRDARRRQPAALDRPGEGRDPPRDGGGRERRLGPRREARRQAALEAARRHDARGARRARRLPVHHRCPDAGRGARRLPSAGAEPRGRARPSCWRDGYPAYTTSVGWLGYDDDKIRRLCREALAEGWTRFKLKVGADVEDDVRRAPDRPRGDRAGPDAGGRRQPALGRRRGDRLDGRARRRSTRTGSRSRPAPTTSSATPRSPAPSRRSGSRPASTSTTG